MHLRIIVNRFLFSKQSIYSILYFVYILCTSNTFFVVKDYLLVIFHVILLHILNLSVARDNKSGKNEDLSRI